MVEEADDLITFREFVTAIKTLADVKFHSKDPVTGQAHLRNCDLRILPRTLSFREVLNCSKFETAFQVTDTHLDDFAMFRYELNSIFNCHRFEDEKPSSMFMGQNPLSKMHGQMLRDLDDSTKTEVLDKYRPPGVLKTNKV